MVLEKAGDALDFRIPYSPQFYASLEKAEDILKQAFYTEQREDVPIVSAVGHTHIDIAWLWTVEQTREKALRSFSTVLALMKEYPDYKFMSSQPILYQFVKDQAPELYEEIKKLSLIHILFQRFLKGGTVACKIHSHEAGTFMSKGNSGIKPYFRFKRKKLL